jgi:HAD superfamily hydrolase (TIGR01549 family)
MAPVTAVIWDFDGTLVDTRAKNLAVTRRLVRKVRGDARPSAALASMAAFDAALHRHQRWQDFYTRELGLRHDEVEAVAGWWMQAQIDDTTGAASFDGVEEVLQQLGHLPQGIVSLNARDNILRIVRELEIHEHFGEVLGFEAVPMHRGKPEPDALLMCIERLTDSRPGTVLYVGDHETDAICAARADTELRRQGGDIRVQSAAVEFGALSDPRGWSHQPDHVVAAPADLLGIVHGLGPI